MGSLICRLAALSRVRGGRIMNAPPIRYFARVHDLRRVPAWKRNAEWWIAVRRARDELLEVLRGPFDKRVLRILIGPTPRWVSSDPQWQAGVWAGALQEAEAWSVRLDAAYVLFVTEQTYPLQGRA